MTKEIFFCVLASFFSAFMMKAPKNSLINIIAGSTITASIERLLTPIYGELISCMLAMACLVFFCELSARILQMPSTVILMPSTIPLLPGSAIYYTMFYMIASNNELMLKYAKSTAFAGLGIALGGIISSMLLRFATEIRHSGKM